MDNERSIFFEYVRLILLFLFLIILLIISKPTPVFTYIGMIFAFSGEAIRFWAAGYLIKTKELITDGPYRHTQHPLHLGRLLILTGICLMAKLPYLINFGFLLFGYLIFFLYYLPRKIKVEGQRLRSLHGEQWKIYNKSVPTLFPRIKGYGEATGGWSSERMLRNREHYMVLGITILILIFLWKSYQP
jgi:protein-S-isoprenylcysteine O-methyltransferase Ste14